MLLAFVAQEFFGVFLNASFVEASHKAGLNPTDYGVLFFLKMVANTRIWQQNDDFSERPLFVDGHGFRLLETEPSSDSPNKYVNVVSSTVTKEWQIIIIQL